ncbi:SLBB domain-containing protein [Spongiibacter sp. KMU-158]|uniref:SLBB domain-containing protein n=1 Tax=Spongiibacter pelagi TaxID=2760804 RepID=A0A927GWM7_9GAMM|nr:SLBB domain-containing protein [Spongiibacter pelagi]MBD2859278.1 SLBB domain-containing protein [Spongiibacter pelagi]
MIFRKVISALVLFLPLIVAAQTISPAQIAQFKSLPRAQQEALAQQYGVDLGAIGGGQSSVDGSQLRNPAPLVVPLSKPSDSRLEESNVQTKNSAAENETTVNKLEPFGYDLFAGVPSTFAPAASMPVPGAYTVGPGDEIRVQLWGKENRDLTLVVDRNGVINFPEIGPESVAGLSFADLKERVNALVSQHFIGVKASVSLGELRSVQIFVLGEARAPGAYTVSSLSTITNALFASGGVKRTGSLRNVQLKRKGQLLGVLDLYDLLLKGDTSADQRLQPGDVIFIPPVGQLAGIKGEVRRPALYELKGTQTIAELVRLSGGFTADAYPKRAQLQRVDENFNLRILDLDLTERNSENVGLKTGDVLAISSVTELAEGFVSLEGEAVRTGRYAWRPGLRVSDLIGSLTFDVTRDADYRYALRIREKVERNTIEVEAFNLRVAVEDTSSPENLGLASRDRVILLSEANAEQRQAALADIVKRLENQTGPREWAPVVRVNGAVRFPGSYPIAADETLSEVLAAAGGAKENALLLEGEITRYVTNEKGIGETRILPFSPVEILTGNEDIVLQGRDSILIKTVPDFAKNNTVTLLGEVLYPGTYTFQEGETLEAVLARAGGLTASAFAKGAVFTRERLRLLEAQRLKEAEDRLQNDLLGVQLAGNNVGGDNAERVQQAQGLLEEVQNSAPVGRMVINLEAMQKGERYQNVILQDGDKLQVPPIPQSVTVLGEVQFPTSHLYQPGLSVDDYLERSGGATRQADQSRVYVVKADGSVLLPNRSRWFGGRRAEIGIGDTIIMPIDVDRLNKLELWTNLSQIIYQMALGAAAVGNL